MIAVGSKGPLRKVVRLVQRKYARTAKNAKGKEYTIHGAYERELLSCGHLFEAPIGLHGTTIGDRGSRRCAKCSAGLPSNDLTNWVDL